MFILVIFGAVFIICNILNNFTSTEISNFTISNIALNEDCFEAKVSFQGSGSGFKSFEYEIENESLYITVISNLSNKNHTVGEKNIRIEDDLKDIKFVYLTNNNSKKLIYTKP